MGGIPGKGEVPAWPIIWVIIFMRGSSSMLGMLLGVEDPGVLGLEGRSKPSIIWRSWVSEMAASGLGEEDAGAGRAVVCGV